MSPLAMIVAGGGVNELVAAHYLARAGHRVLVVREGSPNAASEPEPGWVPQVIVKDLELDKHGLSIDLPDPWLAAMLPHGGRFELWTDVARSVEAIRAVSARDASRWPEFCRRMHTLARALEDLYTEPPPDPLAQSWRDLAGLAGASFRLRRLGAESLIDLLRLAPMSIADLLDEWFENDALKGALAAAGIMHLSQGVRSGGTALNFLHHHVGSPEGVFRQSRSNAARVLSGLQHVETREAKVAQIVVKRGRATGVVLENGETLEGRVIASGAHPRRTLLEWMDAGWLDPQLVRTVRSIRSRGVVSQVTLTLDRDPRFTTLANAPSLDYLERAYDHAKYGRISREPFLEALAYKGSDEQYRVHAHMQYTPYSLREGAWDPEHRSALARVAIDQLSMHVPGLAGWVTDASVRSPLDLEQTRAAPEGQVYHAELGLDQLLWMRPVPDLAHYRTPIHGLYLCGPATHPGGGIAGASGANAARVILRDLRKRA